MKLRPALALAFALLLALAGGAGYLVYQDAMVPIPLAEGAGLFVKASPEFGEDARRLEVLLPTGPGVEQFLANQSDLTLLLQTGEGAWAGQLLSGLQGSRHGRRWRLAIRTGWRLQDGAALNAGRVAMAVQSELARLDGEARVVDGTTLELLFRQRQKDLPMKLTQWRVPGSGPFIRKGQTLTRFDGFIYGKAGVAGLSVVTDPSLLESHAWAEGLVSGRWAVAAFPGHIEPEDMAKVRLAGYDEFRLKGGSVWFLSRRMRRLRPDVEDWTRTRLFGVWKGSSDLPFDPLGL